MAKAQAELDGITLTVAEACESQCDLTDVTTNIETFAADTTAAYDLIIGIGFSALDGINISATAHTDRNFMLIDEKMVLDNVWSITFKEHEGSFLVGAMAAMVSKTDDIAFLGGLDIPLINRFLAGFEHGARTITPTITVRATYSSDPNNPWGDLEGGKTIAKQFIKEGSDVIFAAAGGTGLGAINGVVEHNKDGGDKVYAIGVDSDQDAYAKGDVLASMVKRVDLAVADQINATVWGTWAKATENRGIKEDGVDISPMNHTQTEAKVTYSGSQTRWDKVQELLGEIANDTITVRSDPTAAGATIEFVEEEDSPFPVIPILLAVFVTTYFIRRRRKLN